MPTEILISSDPWENRVAILEDGQLAEIYFEREEKVIGSIFKGKVMNVLPGMGASFVDIGLGRNAFLYVDDINKTPLNIGDVEITQGRSGWTITEKVERGEDVLVQIVKEPRGLKGARISTNISLPGRYLILMPTGTLLGRLAQDRERRGAQPPQGHHEADPPRGYGDRRPDRRRWGQPSGTDRRPGRADPHVARHPRDV